MTVFWIVAGAMLLAALAFVVTPLVRREASPADPEETDANVGIYRERLRALDAELAAGAIDGDRHRELKADLDRALVEDLGTDRGTDEAPPASPGPGSTIEKTR